ncbi:MAG: hypothetical protein IPL61_38155 [Myxococcales bacterium]|nr:hypothetical protein [Myxococcales bacterium]
MAYTLASTLATARETVLSSWAHRYDRSTKRGPGARVARQHGAIVSGLLEALAVTVAGEQVTLAPGHPAMRDLEKATVFAGATWSSEGATGFEVAAIVATLRDAVLEHADLELAPSLTELFEWLSILALDAFATAGRRSVAERAAEQLEAGTPVLLLTPELPAVLLVGAPTEDVLDSVLARAMLLVVRVGAPTLLLDVSGLADETARPVTVALARLFEHRRMGQVELAVVGAGAGVADRWRRTAESHKVATSWFERFDDALAHAATRAGLGIVRRS